MRAAALPDADRTLDQALAAIERRDRGAGGARPRRRTTRAATLEGEAAVVAGAQRCLAEREQAGAGPREKEIERVAKHAARDALKEARAELERAIATVKEEKYREARRALEDAMARAAADEAAAAAVERGCPRALRESPPAPPAAGRLAPLAAAPAVGGGASPVAPGRPAGRGRRRLSEPRRPRSSLGTCVRVPSLGPGRELESAGEVRAFILVRGRRVRVATADLVLAGPGDEGVEREPPAALGEAGA